MTTRSTYVWNGTTWDEICIAVATGPAGVGVPPGGAAGYALVKNSTDDYDTIWSSVAGGLPDQSGNNGKYLKTNGSAASWETVSAGSRSFTTATYTTASIANNAYETGTLNMSAVYTALNLETDIAARVRLYVSTTARDADATRAIGTDPADDSGVLMDVVTTGSTLNFQLSPVVDGWVATGVAIPITVTNLSGSTDTVAATLTYSS